MLLARQDELRLASLLVELQQFPVFSVQQFEAAIDSIRTCVAEVRKAFPHLSENFHVCRGFGNLL